MSRAKLLITDTHFGVKQNSINWLNSQKKFIYDQFIEYITTSNEEFDIIHLGDMFDSRSSISTFIATEVVGMIRDICKLSNIKNFYIISGNHDYYSPNSNTINTNNLLLTNIDTKVHIVDRQSVVYEDCLFVPWYEWFDVENVNKLVIDNKIKYVFTHADIVNERPSLKGVKIFSGHVHIPYIKHPIYNLGSCYYLNFGDSNSQRGFYILSNDKLHFVANETSIKFWRLYNDDILNMNKAKYNQWDYIELYIDRDKVNNPEYYDKINSLQKSFKNVRVIPQINQHIDMQLTDFGGYDIEQVINGVIPDKLKTKFAQVIEKIKSVS